jgi:hypothetical protein
LANRIRQREMSVSLKNSTLIRFKKSSLYLLDKQSLRQHLQDALSVYFWLRDRIVFLKLILLGMLFVC